MRRLPRVPVLLIGLLLAGAASGVIATSAMIFLLVLAGFTGGMAILADRHQKR
ncbi:MAG: hypothetical protein P8M16_08545 [Acidimicrobiales bacterium]|nr:hypothetical protein [Acidimicrobiales bacterium]